MANNPHIIYTQKHKVLLSADGAFVLPDGVQRYDLCTPNGEAYSIACAGVSHTYTTNTSSDTIIRSYGESAISITTTGTLYIILFY